MTDVTTKSLTQSADRIVTREVKGEDTELIKVPISSTRPDRDGDEFSEEALARMQKQIRRQQPLVHQNHGFVSFDKPLYPSEETIGTQVDAEIEEAKDDGEDKDLVAFINPDDTHPEGERLLKQVKGGQAVKFSVGFRVKDAEPKDPEREDGPRIFNDVDLMETSRVGIPSNPDASAQVAAKAAVLSENLTAAGVDIDDPATFASALARELVRRDGPVTRETVEAATPVRIDGQSTVTRRDVLNNTTATPTVNTDSTINGEWSEAVLADAGHLEAYVKEHGGQAFLDGLSDWLDWYKTDTMGTNETREEGDPCDDNGDCGDGMVCVDGECVPEDEEESARLSRLESRFASLEETITDALGDGGEPPEDDTAAEQPTETFSVEIDGEDKEFSPDDIRELAAAADDGEPAESKTVTDPEAHDGTEVEETDDDTPEESNDSEPNTEQSLQEVVHQ